MGDVGNFVNLFDRINPAMRGAGIDFEDFVLSFSLSRRKDENQIASRGANEEIGIRKEEGAEDSGQWSGVRRGKGRDRRQRAEDR